MTTSTHLIPLNDSEYVNLSNGNLNCIIVIQYSQNLRIVFGGSPPLNNTPEHVKLKGAENTQILAVYDLLEESDVWGRAEAGEEEIVVVRGEAKIHIGSA